MDTVRSLAPEEFDRLYTEDKRILDVRNEPEWTGGVIEGAHLVPLMQLPDAMPDLRKDLTYYVHCAGGYRSMIACSLMKRNGFQNVINITGGMNQVKQSHFHLVVPPTVTA